MVSTAARPLQEAKKTNADEWLASVLSAKANGVPESIASLNTAAVVELSSMKAPGNRDEAWRQTDLVPLYATRYGAAAAPVDAAALQSSFSAETAHRLVFVDGVFSAGLSSLDQLPEGCYMGNLAGLDSEQAETVLEMLQSPPETVHDDDKSLGSRMFTTINQACFSDVACVMLQDGVSIEEPVQVTFVTTGSDGSTAVSHPRLAVVTGKECKLELLQTYASQAEAAFTNVVGSVRVGDGSSVRQALFVEPGDAVYHIESQEVAVGSDANYQYAGVQSGGALNRLNVGIDLNGEDSDVQLKSFTIGSGRDLVDMHSAIRHHVESCTSNQQQRNVVGDKAHAVWRGIVKVDQEAQKTDSNQLCKSLLLSEGARIDVQPCLEIIADDVKCAHGATISDLDMDEIFYLNSRGIDGQEARLLLVQGFANEVLKEIPFQAAKPRVQEQVKKLMPSVLELAEKRAGDDITYTSI